MPRVMSITNAHVVENASTVRVTLADEREFDARVVGRDNRLDLAVLVLEGAANLPRARSGRASRCVWATRSSRSATPSDWAIR